MCSNNCTPHDTFSLCLVIFCCSGQKKRMQLKLQMACCTDREQRTSSSKEMLMLCCCCSWCCSLVPSWIPFALGRRNALMRIQCHLLSSSLLRFNSFLFSISLVAREYWDRQTVVSFPSSSLFLLLSGPEPIVRPHFNSQIKIPLFLSLSQRR